MSVPLDSMLGVSGPGALTSLELHERISRGLPREALRRVGLVAGVLPPQLAGLLGVHLRTIKRAESKRSTRLDPVLSDRLYRLAFVVARAGEVMESAEAGRRWLARSQHGLGGRTPLSLLGTEAGTSAVLDLLGRIEDGNLA
ncbi:MAG: DUF2384 domain-containing protein [Planctomycetes bacterium]|nr:DUF2384 domain-containing protein [Planctomycetota bacterium]